MKKTLAIFFFLLLVFWMPEIGEACPFLGYADAICCKLLITEGIACLVTVVPYVIWIRKKLYLPWWLAYSKMLLLLLSTMPFWNSGFNICSTQFIIALTFVIMLVMDAFVLFRKSSMKKSGVQDVFVRDYPVGKDDYHRGSHARRLVEAIVADAQKPEDEINGAYTINIDEEYGQGKSSYMILMEGELRKRNCIYFYFRPWRNSSPSGVTSSFFKELSNRLSPYIYYKERESLNKYAKTVAEFAERKLGLPELIGGLFAEKSQEGYFNEISSLLKDRLKRPVVVLIDDVDRLKSEELWAVLSLIRNTADFPYLYYVMAADKNYMVSTLARDLGKVENVDFFLQKIINLNVLFPSIDYKNLEIEFKQKLQQTFTDCRLNDVAVDDLYGEIEKKGIFESAGLMDVFTNYRSINRFFSMFRMGLAAYSPEMFDHNMLLSDYVKIELVKYLRPDIYRMLRDEPTALMDLVGESHRYALNEESKELVYQEATTKIHLALEKDKDKQKEHKRHLKDLTEAKRDRQTVTSLYVYNLLSDMFADRINYQEERSIRRWSNYDWYFTAEEHSDMMSFTKFLEVFMSGSGLKEKFEAVIEGGKQEAFYQNLRQLYQHPDLLKSEVDKLDCLKKTFACVEMSATAFQRMHRDLPASRFYAMEWAYGQYMESSCFHLLSKYYNHSIAPDAFVEWVKGGKVDVHAKILLMNQVMMYREHCVLSNEDIDAVYKQVCTQTVMNLSAMDNPYNREGIDLIGYCNAHFDGYWRECLINYYNGLDAEMLKRWMLLCVYWSQHQNCFELLSDVVTKLFGYDKFFDKLSLVKEDADLKTLHRFLKEELNIKTATVEEYPILERVKD